MWRRAGPLICLLHLSVCLSHAGVREERSEIADGDRDEKWRRSEKNISLMSEMREEDIQRARGGEEKELLHFISQGFPFTTTTTTTRDEGEKRDRRSGGRKAEGRVMCMCIIHLLLTCLFLSPLFLRVFFSCRGFRDSWSDYALLSLSLPSLSSPAAKALLSFPRVQKNEKRRSRISSS